MRFKAGWHLAMRTRTKWLIFGALVIAAALAALPLFHITLKLDLPSATNTGGGQPQALPSGWGLWVAAWVTCALVGFVTICVFVFRLLRHLLGWRPNP